MDLLEILKRQNKIGGQVKGPGNGVSDSIPTSINGEQPAALSEGEFVIRADVVSNLGGGATDPGAKILDDFMAIVLKMDRDTAAMFGQIITEVGETLLDREPKIEDNDD